MKRIFSCSLLAACLFFIGCGSTSVTEGEKERNTAYANLEKINHNEALLLTYQFQDALSQAEYQALTEHFELEETRVALNSYASDTRRYSSDIALGLLSFSNVWEKAYLKRDLLSTSGLIFIAAATLSALKPANPPIYTSSYFPQDHKVEGVTDEEILENERKKIQTVVEEFANENGYILQCDKGCEVERNTTFHSYVFWLGLKDETLKKEFHRPNALKITISTSNKYRHPSNDTDGISDQPWGWFVDLKGPNSWSGLESRDGIEFQSLSSSLYGTDIGRVFLSKLTQEIKNLSVVYRGKYNIHYQVAEAYDKGVIYALNPELVDFSLIKGKLSI